MSVHLKRHWLALALVLPLALVGCDGAVTAPPVEFRIPVEVAEVSENTVEDLIVTTGTLRARESVVLSVETPGFLEVGRKDGLRLAEGDSVAVGTRIAETTGEDARLASRLNATRLNLEAARQELDRRQQLYDKKLASEEELSRIRATFEAALHDYEMSKRTSEKARIVTPIDGVILQLARDTDGRPMADGQKVLAGFEIARIAPTDTLIADVDLVGPELARVRPGQEVQVSHYAFPGMTLPGRVLRLSPQMDPRTHTFRVEVEVGNAEGLLKPGMFIQASIVSERRENVATVPREAVAKRAGRDVVFVIDGQRAAMRVVRLGVGERLSIEIRDGVAAGERVAVRGLETLTDETRVRVITP